MNATLHHKSQQMTWCSGCGGLLPASFACHGDNHEPLEFIEKEGNTKRRTILDGMLQLEYVDGPGTGSQKEKSDIRVEGPASGVRLSRFETTFWGLPCYVVLRNLLIALKCSYSFIEGTSKHQNHDDD